jgi:rhodanese-related sulfurtransferase
VRNREQHPLRDDSPPPLLDIDEVCRHAAVGAILLDGREQAEYARGHLRGAVNVGLHGRFAESVGTVVSPDRDIILVGDAAIAQEAKTRLARVGFDRVIGQLRDLPSIFTRWHDLVETASRFTPEQVAELLYMEPDLQLVDVRNPGETAEGVIHGAREIPLPSLTDSIDSLDYRAPVVTYCASGYRSLVAASLLRASGFHAVADLLGGYNAWQESGAA